MTNQPTNPLRANEADYLERLAENADEPLKKELIEKAAETRRLGRKPLPEHKKRKNPVLVRFTDGEIEFLRLIAEENERELAELVHELVVKAAEDKFLDKNQNDQ